MTWRSAALIASATLLVALSVVPLTQQLFPISIIARGLFVADTLFHELGHSVVAWALGQAAIPAIFTVFGSDQAGGMSLMWNHSWAVQIAAWATMIYGCWWLWQEERALHAVITAVASLLLFGLSFWSHYPLIIQYMGHGGSILVGGFFFYRGLLDLDARHAFERWLNLFLGLGLLGRNFAFAWQLGFDSAMREDYGSTTPFGAIHHDFMAMQEEWFRLSVQGIAQTTCALIVGVLALTVALAYWRRNDYG